ncbi:Helicase associated domain (HA2) [Ceratobasidium sp. AG-Ba]|nr:Helicase associated domain (HA2) [Ceratobasidium sp. AG-Ba]
MGKNKKTKLKPVARPFATTSIAKKVVETPPEEPLAEAAEDVKADSPKPGDSNGTTQPQVDEFDADRAEIESLQILVDQQQVKAEKEALRLIKSLEQESRASKLLPRVNIDPVIRDRILDMIKAQETSSKLIPEPEDKVLPRLAAIYGSLRGIGLPESRIDECLRAIPEVDLDSALEWARCCSVHYIYVWLIGFNQAYYPLRRGGNRLRESSVTPLGIAVLTHEPSLLGLNGSAEALPANGASEIQEAAPPLPSSAPTSRPNPKRVAAITTTDSDDEPGVDVDVNTKWARTKIKLHLLKFAKPKGFKLDPNDPVVQKLESRLEALQSDYEFTKKRADYIFRDLLKTAEAAALEESLRHPRASLASSNSTPVGTPNPEEPNFVTTVEPAGVSAPQPTKTANSDALDQHSDDEGGFFGHMLDEMPTEVTTVAGDVVRVYDLAFPKNWNGSTPKSALKDYVVKLDQFAVMSYRSVGDVTRVARAAVQIRWRGKPGQEWIAPDACHTLIQAENYAALVALHSLACPVRAGFVGLRSTSTAVQPSAIRSLPASAQDLWKELETKRKQTEDEINRQNVAPAKQPVVTAQTTPPNSRQTAVLKEIPGLKEEFEARRSSKSYQEMLSKRNELPIAAFKSGIIETLDHHQVIVLSGETGCGKSTQLPAYILEHQLSKGLPCRIYCTEPRRISAISLAQRVSRELGEPPNAVGTLASLIGYSVRLESNITRNTRLAFVTNGIALRMLENGSGSGGNGTAFDDVTHIIIDEVHERSIESDFLLIVLKAMMQRRPDLKIVLMSATVDAKKVSEYFGGLNRTFPVHVQYLEDAVEFTKWSIDDDSPYALHRSDKFSRSKKPNRLEWSEETAPVDEEDEGGESVATPVKLGKQYSKSTVLTIDRLDERRIPYDLIIRLLERICLEDTTHSQYSAAVLVFLPGLGEIRQLTDILGSHREFGSQSFRIYPLHSALPSESQTAVFEIPPPGVRKIVVSTNIAETGVTIPDITCVIDSGRHKEMRFDEKRQTSRLIETTIARSNAAQRRGRAGRVQEGICFHLFTKSRHDSSMVDNPSPEILRLGLADLALRIKIMNVEIGTSVEDVLSRALDPPSSINIQRAVNALIEVKALTTTEQITALGRQLSKLPMDVHLGKFLLQSVILGCLDAALTICATLNAKSPFLKPFGFETQADAARMAFAQDNSDFVALNNAFSSWRRASASGHSAVRKFCRENYLSYQNLQQVEDLRQQFMGYLIDSGFVSVSDEFTQEFKRIRFQRNRTKFMNIPEYLNFGATNLGLIQAALTAGLFPKIISIDPGTGYMQTISNNRPVAFHPSSVNFKKSPRDFGSNYLCYSTLMQTKKLYASETGPASNLALILLCGDCEFKVSSEQVVIDRKIRYRVSGKTALALKMLKARLASNMTLKLRAKQQNMPESDAWSALALELLKSPVDANQKGT